MSRHDIFHDSFTKLTGHDAMPWQTSLYERCVKGDFPPSCSLPTGLGKTSIIHIWLIALAAAPAKVPRRLVYVVNRRTVVDQATREAEKLRANLGKIPALGARLAGRCEMKADSPLAISTLRGQFADNAEWRNDPSRPAIIVGTVDMIGSRLLFSGYGCGFKTRPLHAGFLGQDALLVHDEAHLEPAFQKLIETIRDEQKKDPAPLGEKMRLAVMALTATPRGSDPPFELTDDEKNPPKVIPDPPTKPIHHVWRRLKAKKGIAFHKPESDEEKVADRIGKLAKKYSGSGSAVLVFVNSLEDHATVCKALNGEQVQVLTGTLRGLERDRMADPRKETGCRIFAGFLKPPKPDADENERWKIERKQGTVYLVCTSAGEVGIDISADHMVCDLVALDRMAQRLGRVNRFGDGDAHIDIVHEAAPDKKKQDTLYEQARRKTLELLRSLPTRNDGRHDASPLALGGLPSDRRQEAFTPEPVMLYATDILFDAWALTTVRGQLPGRPPVEPYLHGIEDEKMAETHIAWRQEVWELRREFADEDERQQFQKFAAELLDDYPLKPHEVLGDSTFRKNSGIRDKLAKLAKISGDLPVWIQDPDGSIVVTILSQVFRLPLAGRTLILPPEAGGLEIDGSRSVGLFDGLAPYQSEHRDLYDVADEWKDDKGQGRRVRVWEGDENFDDKTKHMRLIRKIDTRPDADKEEGEEPIPRRFWHWYESPAAGDGDGSKSSTKPVLWEVHTKDIVKNATDTVAKLPLADEIKQAVILAARFHDLGKRRASFQRILGNSDARIVLAKSGMKRAGRPERFRHEFASLFDVLDPAQEHFPEFQKLSEEMKELVLHLIAAHHGRARPHFPSEEAVDQEQKGRDVNSMAIETPRRFARLQRKYGRWGLAYLESLLRAADYAASANPSAFVERQKEDQP